MLFLMGVLALLLTTPNANADDKEKYKLFAEETRLFPINIKMSQPSFWQHTAGWKSPKRPASTSAPSSEDFIISTVK